MQFENTYFLVTEWPLSVQSMQENSKVNLVRSKVPPKCSLWGTSFFRGHSASLNNIFGASVIPQPTGCDKNVLLPRSSRTITPSNLLPTVPTKTPCSLGSRSSLAWQYLLEALRIQWPFFVLWRQRNRFEGQLVDTLFEADAYSGWWFQFF